MSDTEFRRVAGGDTSVARPRTPALPATVTDLLAQRKTLRTRTLNDDVDDIHLRLWDNPKYQQYFMPIWREDTVEGNFVADDMMAALQVRQFANETEGFHFASHAKLMSIVHSLHVVCRRYGISRKERQGLVGDEAVDPNNDGYGNNG